MSTFVWYPLTRKDDWLVSRIPYSNKIYMMYLQEYSLMLRFPVLIGPPCSLALTMGFGNHQNVIACDWDIDHHYL